MHLIKKADSSQVLWKMDGKSQNRPFLHFNAYNLLNNCHFNCGNRPLLLIGNICIIYFNFAFVIHFFWDAPIKTSAQQPTSFTDGAKVEPRE